MSYASHAASGIFEPTEACGRSEDPSVVSVDEASRRPDRAGELRGSIRTEDGLRSGHAAKRSKTVIPSVMLANGVAMPALGFGTWPMDDVEAESAVAAALRAGYRLIDTAEDYRNEAGVGRGVRASGVDRGEVFVTTRSSTSAGTVRKRCIERSRTAPSGWVWTGSTSC
jgi:hypothetical protein